MNIIFIWVNVNGERPFPVSISTTVSAHRRSKKTWKSLYKQRLDSFKRNSVENSRRRTYENYYPEIHPSEEARRAFFFRFKFISFTRKTAIAALVCIKNEFRDRVRESVSAELQGGRKALACRLLSSAFRIPPKRVVRVFVRS